MEASVTTAELLARLGVAVLLGAALGAEREFHDKPAGLRTLVLVSLGSAGFALVGLHLAAIGASTGDEVTLDPIRVINGLMSGIGFLGAGSIIRQGDDVDGVTTAATIWAVGAIGLACGFGALSMAALIAALALVALVGMRPIRAWIDRRRLRAEAE